MSSIANLGLTSAPPELEFPPGAIDDAEPASSSPPRPPEFDDFPDDPPYEVVRGVRVELLPMSTDAAHVITRLGGFLWSHVERAKVGRVEVGALFRIRAEARTSRRPDVAFVSYDRWPREARIPRTASWHVVPDLTVEVVSPTDLAEDAMEKIRDYFEAGVRLVWNVFPRLGVVHVYESFSTIRVLGADGELDGGDVVRGFRLPLASLFDDLGE